MAVDGDGCPSTVTVMIPSLASPAAVDDLLNALVGVSGVEALHADRERGALTVSYDPQFLDPIYLRQTIERVGYPLARQP
jgi:hypothetical protein